MDPGLVWGSMWNSIQGQLRRFVFATPTSAELLLQGTDSSQELF